MRRCGNAEDIKKTQKLRRTNAPRQLPHKRPRQLTLPLPDQPSRGSLPNRLFSRRTIQQQTSDQTQSPLFRRLPYEVRRLIWSHIVAGHLLHIVRIPGRVRAIKCAEDVDPELETRGHHCWGINSGGPSMGTTPWYYDGPLRNHPARPLNCLALLQTCRMIYGETISMLYADNLWDIDHLDTLFYLERSVLPRRREEVRMLNLTWDFKYHTSTSPVPYDMSTWRQACETLASFVGLQELTLHLTGEIDLSPGLYWKSRWGPLLEELRLIRAPQRFEVFLPWPEDKCAEAAEEGNYPFRIRSRMEKPPFRDSLADDTIEPGTYK